MINHKFDLKKISSGLILTTTFVSGLSCISVSAQEKPNVILVLVDDMGWSDVGFNGSKFYETPNLDNFAKIATNFTNGYSACAVSSPARASIMTGQYPSRVGITDWLRSTQYDENPDGSIVVPEDSITKAMMHKFLDYKVFNMAQAFKSKGYTTCHIGKWHLGGGDYKPEALQGFDINFGGGHIGHPQSYFYPWDNPNGTNPIEGMPASSGEYLTDVEARNAVNFINTHKDEPFYLNMWHYTVHAPVQAKQEYINYFNAKARVPNDVQTNSTYAGMIKSLDDAFGSIYKALEDNNLLENTVIIFTSDNGHERAYSTSPILRGAKGDPYEGGVREPFLVYWPGVSKPGESKAIISGQDIMPTLCKAIGVEIPDGQPVDGIDIKAFIADPTLENDRTIFWHFPHYWGYGVTPYSAIRSGDWKLIKRYVPESYELYNLIKDIGEKTNLVNEYPEKTKELKDELLALLLSTNSKIPMSTKKVDNNSLINQEEATFNGEWTKYDISTNYMQDLRGSTTKDDSFEYEFNGVGIEIFGNLHPNYGDLAIYVDGKYETLIHQRSESAYKNVKLLKIDNLKGGNHVLKAVVTTSGKTVNIDALKPIAYNFSPENGSDMVSITTNLTIFFSEPINTVAGKKLYVMNGDEIVQEIELSKISKKYFSTLNIPLNDNLKNNTQYHIILDDDAFINDDGNYYSRITNASTWSFKTATVSSGNFGWEAAKGTYFDLGESGPVLTDNFTLEMWVKPDGNNSGWAGLIGYNPGSNNDRSPFINIYNNTKLEYGFGTGTSYISKFSTANVLTTNAWNHIALTFNGTSMVLYINGELAETYAGANGKKPKGTPIRFLNLVKATAVSTSSVIDEIRIWSAARTATEIQENLYKSVPANSDGLLAYWKMNGNFKEQTTNNFSGSLTGTESFVPVEYNSSIEINPVLITETIPIDNASNVSLSPSYKIAFNDTVNANGNFKLRLFSLKGEAVDSIQVTELDGLNTDTVKFSLTKNLEQNKGYYIQIDKGAFMGNKTSEFQGTINQKDWTFFTGEADLSIPIISSFTPSTNSTVKPGMQEFKLGFSKEVHANNDKSIYVYSENGVLFEKINVQTLTKTHNDTMTFNLSKALEIDSCYYLLVDDAAFFDNIGNLTKGIAYYWQWNISVVSLDINAIKKPQKQSIHCYPNPITNDLFVELDKEANYKISIINIKGQVVLTENIWGKSAHFSTQNLNTGFYFLSVIGDDTQTQVKLIRK